jgi:hypothetical protein
MSKDATNQQQTEQPEQPMGESLIPYREQRVRYPEAAQITKLKIDTLRKHVSRRTIPHEKIGTPGSHGGAVLFRVGSLLDWMAGHAVVVGEVTE